MTKVVRLTSTGKNQKQVNIPLKILDEAGWNEDIAFVHLSVEEPQKIILRPVTRVVQEP